MAGTIATKATKDQSLNRSHRRASNQPLQSIESEPTAEMLALQESAGNRAVNAGLRAGNSTPVAAAVEGLPPIVKSVLQSSGQPLDPATRSYMESRFGEDFSGVRVHTDGKAAESAQAVNANAYTVNRDVVFDVGKYAPNTQTGKRLLAHELAHVVQQRRGGSALPSGLSGSSLEQAAEQATSALNDHSSSIQVIGASAPGLARSPAEPYEANGSKIPDDLLISTKHELLDLRNQSKRPGNLYDTYAIVKAVDEKGKVIASASAKYRTAGEGGKHAEAIALKRLFTESRQRGINLQGRTIIVMIDQLPCEGRCSPMLTKLPDSLRVSQRVYTVTLPKPGEPGVFMDPKDALRRTRQPENLHLMELTEFRKDRSTLSAASQNEEAKSPISVAKPSGTGENKLGEGQSRSRLKLSPSESEPSATTHVRRAATKMALNVSAGVAVSFLQKSFKEKIVRDIANLPKPKWDIRKPLEMLEDQSNLSFRLIDLVSKDLRTVEPVIREHHTRLIARWGGKLTLLALTSHRISADVEKQFDYLQELQDELSSHQEELSTIHQNLTALFLIEGQLMAAKRQADTLRDFLPNLIAILAAGTPPVIISPVEYSALDSSLGNYSANIEVLFRDAHQVSDLVSKLIEETTSFEKSVKDIWWEEFGIQLQSMLREASSKRATNTQTAPASPARRKSPSPQYGTLPGQWPAQLVQPQPSQPLSPLLSVEEGPYQKEFQIVEKAVSLGKGLIERGNKLKNEYHDYDRRKDLETWRKELNNWREESKNLQKDIDTILGMISKGQFKSDRVRQEQFQNTLISLRQELQTLSQQLS